MGLFQYKSSSAAAWGDVQYSAYHGTYEGSFDIEYPKPQARDGNFKPCGAVGLPEIVMTSNYMTACGMDFWQSQFSDDTTLTKEWWMTARNSRTNLWSRYTGWLTRPTYERVRPGSGSANTVYEGFSIRMVRVEETA